MTVAELLADRGITTALIIDDAYDDVPRAEDLADDDAWANFLDDIGAEARKTIEDNYPRFRDAEAPELRHDDEFVATVWSLRDSLDPAVVRPFFESYEQGVSTDRNFLTSLETELTKLGLQIVQSGRELPQDAQNAQLVFADLFLGAPQRDPDMNRSIDRLKQLLAGRLDNPPLVILMSRSELLKDKRDAFRDRAQLIGAMFRVHSKSELGNAATLVRTVQRLASFQKDALRVVAFIRAWELGLQQASARFLAVIRRLDLPDYVQVQQILLEFEGQPLGSYLLDVFDRVLQHEIEGDTTTIDTAVRLGSIDTDKYPAPHIAGSADLQELTYRTIWQHPKRLSVPATVSGAAVSFGDLLIARSMVDAGYAQPADDPQAFVTMTASCDLVRSDGAKRILFMAGVLSDLKPATWTYQDRSVRTPIVIFDDARRFWIKWDVKDLRTYTPEEVRALVGVDGRYRVHRRLRESHALEIQQAMLADMGHVGVLAQMPGTFAVRVEVAYVRPDDGIQELDLPALSREGGVCYTGRRRDDDVTRLVLTEAAVDELASSVATLPESEVHEKARGMLRNAKESTLFTELQKGLQLPRGVEAGWVRLKAAKADGQNVDVALCCRNPIGHPGIGNLRQSALLMFIHDIGAEAPEEAATSAQAT